MAMDRKCGNRWRRLLLLACCLGMLAGCAVVNEGSVNYRKNTAAVGKTKTGETLELVKKYDLEEPDQGSFSVSAKDTISINLTQAFIKDFFEVAVPWRFESSSSMRGEIAIVVNAFSLSQKGADFDSTGLEAGRLVYYGDDVHKGQYLNLSYLPVYGPVEYDGNPIMLQIYVIEMDTANAKLKPLLQTLASIGKKCYPPASTALTILDRLGSTLLSQHTDDILLRYYMTFYPTTDQAYPGYPELRPGNYILMRKENRNEGAPQKDESPRFDWSRVRFDPAEGRLVMADAPGQCFTDETYLVFQIQKGFRALADSHATTFAQFRDSLEKKAAASGAKLASEITGLADDILRQDTFNRLRRMGRELNLVTRTDDASITFMAWNYVTEVGEAAAAYAKAHPGGADADGTGQQGATSEVGVLTDAQIEYLLAILAEQLPSQHADLRTEIRNKSSHKALVQEILAKKKQAAAATAGTSGT